MDIRIGNDIRLNVTLKGNKDFNQASTKQLMPYLINTTANEFVEPIDFCSCGCRKRMPMDCCGHPHICGRCGYHHPAHNLYGCSWGHPCFGAGIFNWHWNWAFRNKYVTGPLAPNYGYYPWCYGPYAECDWCIHEDGFKYLAPYKITAKENSIQVYFPAKEQFAQGEYKLVIVVVDYEDGWAKRNLRTYTMDYGVVFRLTDEQNALDGDVELDVYESGEVSPSDGSSAKVIPGYIGVVNVRPGNSFDALDQSFESNIGDQYPVGAPNVDLTKLTQYENVIGTNTVYTNDNSFLWIVTNSPIKSISAGTFDIPLSEVEVYNSKYYYACLNPLANNKSFKLTIQG